MKKLTTYDIRKGLIIADRNGKEWQINIFLS